MKKSGSSGRIGLLEILGIVFIGLGAISAISCFSVMGYMTWLWHAKGDSVLLTDEFFTWQGRSLVLMAGIALFGYGGVFFLKISNH